MGLWSLSSVLSQSFFSLYHFFNYFFFYPLQSVILDIVSSGSIFPTLYLFSHNFSFFFYFIFWVNSSAYSFNLLFQFSFFLLVFNCWIDFSIIVYFCTFFVAVSCFIIAIWFQIFSSVLLRLFIRIFKKGFCAFLPWYYLIEVFLVSLTAPDHPYNI